MSERVTGTGCPHVRILPQKIRVSLKLGKTAPQATTATSSACYFLLASTKKGRGFVFHEICLLAGKFRKQEGKAML